MNPSKLLPIFFTLTILCNMTWLHSSFLSLPLNLKKKSPIPIPTEYSALNLIKCPPTKLEQEFTKQFPGQIDTYHHPSGMLILRQVHGATRKLHNTSTCLESSGFKLSNHAETTDSEGRIWQTYHARNAKNDLTVQTIIIDDTGRNWTTVEEWFWSALFSPPTRSYLAISDIRSERLF